MRLDNRYIFWNYPDKCCTTICIIKDSEHNVIARASSTKSENDCFIRNVGRKISLQRVLQLLYPSKVDGHYNQENREQRIRYWNAYKNMTKDPRWK